MLALAGRGEPGAARVLFEQLKNLPTPLSRAQLGAALALAHDTPRAEAAFAAASAAPARSWWAVDYGSALRDQAATLVLLKESGISPDKVPVLAAALPGADLLPMRLNTQEQAWLIAAAAVLGRNGATTRVALNGSPLPEAAIVSVPLTADATVHNLGGKPVWASLSATGVPATALPASRNQMQVRRRFLTTAGDALNLDTMRQNATFIMVLEGRAEDAQPHRGSLTQGLPAGWEVVGRIPDGPAAGMPWLKDLIDVEAQSATNDRFAAVIALDKDKPEFRVAVRLRAVTPGSFELPGAEVADMYAPAIYARQNANRIRVLPPE